MMEEVVDPLRANQIQQFPVAQHLAQFHKSSAPNKPDDLSPSDQDANHLQNQEVATEKKKPESKSKQKSGTDNAADSDVEIVENPKRQSQKQNKILTNTTITNVQNSPAPTTTLKDWANSVVASVKGRSQPDKETPSVNNKTPVESSSQQAKCAVCNKSLAGLGSYEEREEHVNRCLDEKRQSTQSYVCEICSKDLSSYNPEKRAQHVNRCLDQFQKDNIENIIPRSIDSNEFVCPICSKDISHMVVKQRMGHVKSCAKKQKQAEHEKEGRPAKPKKSKAPKPNNTEKPKPKKLATKRSRNETKVVGGGFDPASDSNSDNDFQSSNSDQIPPHPNPATFSDLVESRVRQPPKSILSNILPPPNDDEITPTPRFSESALSKKYNNNQGLLHTKQVISVYKVTEDIQKMPPPPTVAHESSPENKLSNDSLEYYSQFDAQEAKRRKVEEAPKRSVYFAQEPSNDNNINPALKRLTDAIKSANVAPPAPPTSSTPSSQRTKKRDPEPIHLSPIRPHEEPTKPKAQPPVFSFPPPSNPPSQDGKQAEPKSITSISTQPDTSASWPRRPDSNVQQPTRRNNLNQFLEEAEEVVGEYQAACSHEFDVLMAEIETLKEKYYAKIGRLTIEKDSKMHLLRSQYNVPAQLSLLLEAPLFQSPLETEIPEKKPPDELDMETSTSESEEASSEEPMEEEPNKPQEQQAEELAQTPKSKNGSSLDLDVGAEPKMDEAELERTPPVQT